MEVLISSLVDEFDVDSVTVTADLEEFLGQIEVMMNV